VFGEDGKVGMRGRLVTKQGQMLANALRAGIIAGIGQSVAAYNTTVSTSPWGTGVGKALDRLAQYYIKLAEQTFPVIEVDAGREIDVFITKGVRIDPGPAATARPASNADRAPHDRGRNEGEFATSPIRSSARPNHRRRRDPCRHGDLPRQFGGCGRLHAKLTGQTVILKSRGPTGCYPYPHVRGQIFTRLADRPRP
jgi:hypothetical protein